MGIKNLIMSDDETAITCGYSSVGNIISVMESDDVSGDKMYSYGYESY